MENTTHHRKKRFWYVGLVACAFLALFAFLTIHYVYQARRANDELIAQQVQQLKNIFKEINDTCKINGFRHEKDYIDFLNVASFEGSVVGPMSLMEPKNWKGPYLKESLTIGGKEYQIVTTKKGYYIVPGDGVALANGKVIGKTLIINSNSDIDALVKDPQALISNGKPLAARIDTYKDTILALEKGEPVEDTEPLG